MTTTDQSTETLDEKQSFQLIQNMIQVSQQRHNQDGILFIVWGWIWFCLGFVLSHLPEALGTTFDTLRVVNIFRLILGFSGLAFTIYYLIKRNRKVKTYTGSILLYIWIALIVILILLPLAQQHLIPKYMDFPMLGITTQFFLAFATFSTGIIIRQKVVVIGAILYTAFAFLDFIFEFPNVVGVDSIGWLIILIIPGHIVYSKRNKSS